MPKQNLPLKDRVILITGASGGIGMFVALAAAKAGAECILMGTSEKKLAPVYDEIMAVGGQQPALFPLDFTKASSDSYRLIADGIKKDCGRLDGIVHLAARFDGLKPLATHELDDWRRTLHIGASAAFAITQACLPLMQQTTGASVVYAVNNNATQKAFYGAYGVTNAALTSLAKTFALESPDSNQVRFNLVDPGPRETLLRKAAFPMEDPQARPAADAAKLFIHCLSDATRQFNGEIFTADGRHRPL